MLRTLQLVENQLRDSTPPQAALRGWQGRGADTDRDKERELRDMDTEKTDIERDSARGGRIRIGRGRWTTPGMMDPMHGLPYLRTAGCLP
jgi:hypothetical protein